MLNFGTTTRRRIPAWIVFIMLLFAVPFWGLQYKLSLYHSVSERASVPVAKLLSQKERPVAGTHLERLAADAEPSTASFPTIESGGFGTLLICALLAFTWSFVCILAPEETPHLSAPVVSKVGSRAPPRFA